MLKRLSLLLLLWLAALPLLAADDPAWTGTGFVVSPAGYLLTCAHVVKDAAKIRVTLGAKSWEAAVLAVDDAHDLALLQIPTKDLTALPLANSNAIELGQEARAFGYPLSDYLGEDLKVTRGTIAGISMRDAQKIFQIDAAVNPGNSGGPLVNENGEVIGVVNARLRTDIATAVGFAVPINYAKPLLQGGKVPFTDGGPKDKLDGPALVKQVAPSLALISVWEKTPAVKINAKDGAEMVWVPGGTFTMGSPAGVGYADEYPAHKVTLSGYWIYKYDVTVSQYRAFCAATGHKLPMWPFSDWQGGPYFPLIDEYSWKGKNGWDDPALQQHPIVDVNWDDAIAYADWAGVKLPSEAQWEYAARGPRGNNYPWGGTATKDYKFNGWDATKCANYDNSGKVGKSTWPVGSFPAGVSWCGAQDMAGNVWQWCSDWYGAYAATAVTDPAGPATGEYRVLRGGSWYGYSNDGYRSANRNNYGDYPCGYYSGIGFRCVSVVGK